MNKRFRLNTTRLILRNFKKSDNFNNYFEMIRKQSKNNLAVDHSATQEKDIFLKTQNYKGVLVAIFLKNNQELFDIIFFDPPFSSIDIPSLLFEIKNHLKPNGVIYLEMNEKFSSNQYNILKHSKAGKVYFYLLTLK